MAKKEKNSLDKTLMAAAGFAVLFSAIGFTGYDIWLASTQWLLVAAVLALFAVYFKLK